MADKHGDEWDLFTDITFVNAWLDTANADSDSAHENAMRVMKVGEEIGEAWEALALIDTRYGRAVSAYIGMTGQNPRKGVTHSSADLLAELADVAITALCAMQHFTGNTEVTRGMVAAKLASIIKRTNVPTDAPLIPAGYCAACARSGVGACDDFPECPAGIQSKLAANSRYGKDAVSAYPDEMTI